MKLPHIVLLLVSILFLGAAPGCDDVQPELEEVLTKYMKASETGDANTLYRIVDPKNIEHYDRVAHLARTAKAEDIARMPAIDRYWIAVLRAGSTPKELKALDGRGVLLLGAGIPLTEEEAESLPILTLQTVKHTPPRASGELCINGERTKLRIEFVKVGEEWLVNEECLDEWFNQLVHKISRKANMSEEAVILAFASWAVEKPVQIGIWAEPPKLR